MSARRRSSQARALGGDELATATPTSRSSPRRESNTTPYARLRQLAGAIQKPTTPLRTGGTPSASGPASSRRTPGRSAARPARTKQGAPSTPHALRALQQRRAAAAARETPGREQRRRSGRQMRETPRDILRQLSRLEARREAPEPRRSSGVQIATSSARRVSARRAADSSSSEEDEPRPEMTMPIDEDDDDSFQAPPRLSQNFDDESTQLSIEGPRRDLAELGRYGRESIRLSDRFGDPEDMDPDPFEAPDDGFSVDAEDYDELNANALAGGDTEDLRNLLQSRRQSEPGDPSLIAGDAENSFALEIPAEPDYDDSDVEPNQPFIDFGLQETDTFDPPRSSGFRSQQSPQRDSTAAKPLVKAKTIKVAKQSRYGIEYPSLPAAMVKKMTMSALRAAGSSKTKVNPEILAAVTQASDWFFEQLSEDAAAYADHARRKTIDESDILTLMRRQRVLNASTTPFSLAQKHLPRELLQDIRMPAPPKPSGPTKRKRQPLEPVEEESE